MVFTVKTANCSAVKPAACVLVNLAKSAVVNLRNNAGVTSSMGVVAANTNLVVVVVAIFKSSWIDEK